MQYMKAVVVAQQGVVKIADDVPIPEIGHYEVLIKVHACGICNGTDFQVINGTLEEEAGFRGYPTVLGHEGAGEVIKLGDKVRHINLGDRFIHPNLRPDVGNGYYKTYGGMAEYGIGADYKAMLEDGYEKHELPFSGKFHQFPVSIDYLDAAMLLSLSECHSAVANFNIKQGDHVLLYGAGPMGIALAMFMKLRGAEYVVTVDQVPERLDRAKMIAKVDRTINVTQNQLKNAFESEQFDFVVDAVGSTTVLMEGSNFLKPGGKLCSLGVLKKTDSLLPVTRLQNNTTLHMLNQPYGEYAIMDETIDLIVSGKVNPKDFYSHVVDYQNIKHALHLVRSKEAFKVILNFELFD